MEIKTKIDSVLPRQKDGPIDGPKRQKKSH